MALTARERALICLAANKIAAELVIGLNATGFISRHYSAGADETLTKAIAAYLSAVAEMLAAGGKRPSSIYLALGQEIFAQFGLFPGAIVPCVAALGQMALTGAQGILEATAFTVETGGSGAVAYVVAAVFTIYDGVSAYEACKPLYESDGTREVKAWSVAKATFVVAETAKTPATEFGRTTAGSR